jgi:hypothetical protein
LSDVTDTEATSGDVATNCDGDGKENNDDDDDVDDKHAIVIDDDDVATSCDGGGVSSNGSGDAESARDDDSSNGSGDAESARDEDETAPRCFDCSVGVRSGDDDKRFPGVTTS